MYKNLMTVCCAAALALGLAACGGGGSDGPSTAANGSGGGGGQPPAPTPQQMCEEEGGRWNADGSCTSAMDLTAEKAATTKAAGTKETAIAAEAAVAVADDDGLGGDGAAPTDSQVAGEYNLAIKRDRTGTTVTVTVEGATAADNENFMGDQPGEMLTRTMEADADGNVVQEVAVVYTDIEAPKAVAFAMWENAAGDTPQALGVMKDDGEVPGADETANALDFDVSADSVLALIKSSAFTSGTAAVLTFDADDTNTADVDEAFEAAGTYNGAMGVYRCTGSADCTVTLNGMGAITAMAGGWVFAPDAGATSDQPDYDYLHYGFWLKKTTDKDAAVTYNEVQTFAGSSVTASGSIADVTGMATYDGDAAGVYVKNVFNSQGEIDTATSGSFTAHAHLTAYFGGGDIPANKHDTLIGTIDNFMLSGGEDNDWVVSLQSDSDLTQDGIQGSDIGTHTGTAKGSVEGQDGSFSATFHGTADADNQPHTIVGEFNSVFSDGSVAGAFGARKTK